MKSFTNEVCCPRTSKGCLRVQAGALTSVQLPLGQAPGVPRRALPTASHGAPPLPGTKQPLPPPNLLCGCFCSCRSIVATDLGPGPCLATWGPCGVPESPLANCSAPTSPTAMPTGTCPPIRTLPPGISPPLTHMIHCQSNLGYKTQSKVIKSFKTVTTEHETNLGSPLRAGPWANAHITSPQPSRGERERQGG